MTVALGQSADLIVLHTSVLPLLCKPLRDTIPLSSKDTLLKVGSDLCRQLSSTAPGLGVNLYTTAKPVSSAQHTKISPSTISLELLVGPFSRPCCYLGDSFHWIACLLSCSTH